MELFNSWDLSAEQQKKLDNYWKRFENFMKLHSNELKAAWELYNLRQGLSRRIHCKVKNPFEGSQLSGRAQRAIPQGLPSTGYKL